MTPQWKPENYDGPRAKDQAILTEEMGRRICLKCSGEPQVVHLGGLTGEVGTFGLRCRCWPDAPVLAQPPSRVHDRWGKMAGDAAREVAGVPAVKEAAMETVNYPEPMTVEAFAARLKMVEYVVNEMVETVHFGITPGTTDKALWEAGAEYLRAAFQLPWDFVYEEKIEDHATFDYHYVVRAYCPNRNSYFSSWIASAWSHERRFWCAKECPRPCPQNHLPRMEGATLRHNVRDRAIKRAFVALIRNVTGTTGYFKQALDVGVEGGQTKPAGAPTAARPAKQASPSPVATPVTAPTAPGQALPATEEVQGETPIPTAVPTTVAEFRWAAKNRGWTAGQLQAWLGGFSGPGPWLAANPALTIEDAWRLCLERSKEVSQQ